MKTKIILASASPRRRKILSEAGFSFGVYVPEVEEVHWDEPPEEMVIENARRKCTAARLRYPNATIIAADTVVRLGKHCLGKPSSLDAARAMLKKSSGATQQVYTGLAVALPAGRQTEIIVESEVHFKILSDAEIDEYMQKVNPLDKAGGYDIDQHRDLIIEGYRGSLTNIMGLPLEALQNILIGVHR